MSNGKFGVSGGIWAAVLLAAAASGCGRPGSPADDIGEARIAITQVPTDVLCIRIDVTGARTVTRQFTVMPGASSVLALNGLPLGADVFTGVAFPVGCDAVAATTTPTWASDPTPATLTAGAVADVLLVLRRNGRASVRVDFQDETPVCPMGRTLCGTVCVDLRTDSRNCGSCGTICVGSSTCGGGGTPGVCGACMDDGTACFGQVCGPSVNNCGQTVNCGTCGAGRCCFDSCVCPTCACP